MNITSSWTSTGYKAASWLFANIKLILIKLFKNASRMLPYTAKLKKREWSPSVENTFALTF